MYYELYVDSLFLVNFVMNLYLLLLVNQSMYRTATRLRLVLGAAAGAGLYLIPFLYNGPIWVKLLTGLVCGTAAMIFIAFPIQNVRAFCRIVEGLLFYSLLMGGTLLFLIRKVPFLRNRMTGITGILGMGAAAFLVFHWRQEHRGEKECVCHVTLMHGAESICVTALIDSGNSLTEPISGKPVSIIEKDTFVRLWKKEPDFYRAVPFHSIGKKRGILRGYLIPEMHIECDGVVKICRDVYVAVTEEAINGEEDSSMKTGEGHVLLPHGRKTHRDGSPVRVRMILNPLLLES